MKESLYNAASLANVSFTEQEEVLTIEQIHDAYGSNVSGNPSIYCGTYGKYNDGDISGMWLDLTKFCDYEEFMDVCRQLHIDEEDPELMFQDYDSFPAEFYSESCIDEDTFDKIQQYGNLSSSMKEAMDDYLELGMDFDLDNFYEAYQGKWDSKEEFAQNLIDELYDIENMMGSLARYFDYATFADDLFDTDYSMGENGHVFRA